MSAIILTAAMLMAPFMSFDEDILPVDGRAVRVNFSRYDRAPTDDTLQYRIDMEQIDPNWRAWYDGLIAVADCDSIGEEMWAKLDDRWMRLLIFDCAGHKETVEWMRDGNIAGELGYYTAESIGFTHRGVVSGMVIQ